MVERENDARRLRTFALILATILCDRKKHELHVVPTATNDWHPATAHRGFSGSENEGGDS